MPRPLNILSLGAALLLSFGTTVSSSPMFNSPAKGVVEGNPLVQKIHRCHEGWRYDYIPEVGYEAEHRHRSNCRPVILEGGGSFRGRDCHDDAQYHGHGGREIYHYHSGRSCRVQRLREYRGQGTPRGCFKVGPVTVCP